MNTLENDFRPEAQSLVSALFAAGIPVIAGNNGEDDFRLGDIGLRTEAQFIEEVCAADDCALFVRVPGSMKLRQLYLVFGNSPGELVSDYSDVPALNAVVSAHSDKWFGTEQITIRRVA